jgi:hypothetical protein
MLYSSPPDMPIKKIDFIDTDPMEFRLRLDHLTICPLENPKTAYIERL